MNDMNRTSPNLARAAFYAYVVRPTLFVFAKVAVVGRPHLPRSGPIIVVANHNSHLDAMALVMLLGLSRLPRIRLVGAADYFFRGRVLSWFSRHVLGIVGLRRHGSGAADPLAPVQACLDSRNIVVFFPEGTRGQPGEFGRVRAGIERLAAKNPGVPIVPVRLEGLERVLPRGRFLPRRHACSASVHPPLYGSNGSTAIRPALLAQLGRPAAPQIARAV